jgi:transposase
MTSGLARRGKILLLRAAGSSQSAVAQAVGVPRTVVRQWAKRFLAQRVDGLADAPGRGAKGGVPPEVAIPVVRLACERPDMLSRSLSQWACHELARQLMAEGSVEESSASTVRRMLAAHQLKPWRHHLWRHPKHPRAAAFDATVAERIDLYTRPLQADERVRSREEQTSVPPRPRPSPTLPARPPPAQPRGACVQAGGRTPSLGRL